MSTQSLLGYDDLSSLRSAPSYTAEPLENEQRIALNDRSRPLPRGSFVKHSKHGHARLRLLAQEDDITTPVYGFSGLIKGTVELDHEKAETVDSVEVKVSLTPRKYVAMTYACPGRRRFEVKRGCGSRFNRY